MSLSEALAAFPRVTLGAFPTPLQPLPRLTAAVHGPQLWVKRDDAVGPAMGGNKTRKLEFLFGQARAERAEVVATFGGLQSNFARQMVAGARGLGLPAHCFYFARRPARLEGNLLLAQLMGAHLHFVPFPGGDDGSLTIERATRLVRLLAAVSPGCLGRRVFFMPVGGHTAVGALGYVAAALELTEQLQSAGIDQATIVLAAGSGGTLAGLMAGLRLLGSRHQLLGIDVGKLWRGFPASIAALASESCVLLGQPQRYAAADVPLIERTYVGQGYARPTPAGLAAIHKLAELEGLLLDPVYTAKAMAGLLDLAQQGRWGRQAHVVFLHTGGAPALWAYPDSLMASV
jgi:L-cysteate sulfo-lyase